MDSKSHLQRLVESRLWANGIGILSSRWLSQEILENFKKNLVLASLLKTK